MLFSSSWAGWVCGYRLTTAPRLIVDERRPFRLRAHEGARADAGPCVLDPRGGLRRRRDLNLVDRRRLGGDEALNAAAQTAARKAQTAIESYADKNGSYAGANAQALSAIDPSVSAGDLEVVSTDNSYTITVAAASGTTFSIDGEQGGATERTCDPPGDPGCSENGDWG